MRLRSCIVTAMLLCMTVPSGSQAASINKDLLGTLGLPVYPGAKMSAEIGLPAGPMLAGVEKEIGGALPVSSLREVNIATYSIDSSVESTDILKFYDPGFSAQKWKTLVSTVDRTGDATIILENEKSGLLIVDVDPPSNEDRELSFVLAVGTVDTSKIDKKFAEKAGALVSDKLKPRIPAGKPISVPPSEKLDIQSMKSNICARFGEQGTVQLNMNSKSVSPGEITRTPDGRLLLSLSPGLDLDEIVLPENVPVLLETTDGSLTVSGGNTANERPLCLNIIATGAPVKLDSLPLISGTHNIKVLGKSVVANLSQVQGGVLSVEVESGDITLGLPAKGSVRVEASVLSGKIQNRVTSDQPKDDRLSFKMGDGKAQIKLKAINGNIMIKPLY